MTIWRLHVKPNVDDGRKEEAINYCNANNVAAMGWSLKDSHLKYKKDDPQEVIPPEKLLERDKISSFEDYKNFLAKYNHYKNGKVPSSVRRLACEVSSGDLIWRRHNGIYYLGRVSEGSEYRFVPEPEMYALDISNQRTGIEWLEIGGENKVPGAVANAFIKGRTLQRINDVDNLSHMIYNRKRGQDICPINTSNDIVADFYNAISTNDAEDLLCLWLYGEFGYIAIPSTNKKGTELYECVLKNPKTGEDIYPQVKCHKKKGDHIDADQYYEMSKKGEVWLFVTNDNVINADKYANIKQAGRKNLFDFVGSSLGKRILPDSLVMWYEYLQNAQSISNIQP